MLFELIGTFLVAGAVILFIWLLRGLLLMPLKIGKHTKMTTVLHVTGHEPALEQTVKGLCWLRANGSLPGSVVILDDGMDTETAAVARKLAETQAGVCCRRKEVAVWPANEQPKNCTEGSTPLSTAAMTADMQ